MIEATHSELGDFLRSRRQKLNPAALGLARRRRRTPGLRREEVAELAGIGVDWYVRLEQGRAVRPSVTTIDALARALRLSKEERAHLRALAQKGDRVPFVRETVPDQIRGLVESLNQPAYVTGRRWDVLAWNTAAAEIFAFGRLPEEDRNILVIMLTKPGARRLFGAGWTEVAKRIVAQFRAAYDVWAGEPAFEGLVARVRRESPEFAGWWDAHEIGMSVAGHKLMNTPKTGLQRFDYATFQANDDSALKLAIYRRA
jgi:transcriptional regulator with XRE-family HTH domain